MNNLTSIVDDYIAKKRAEQVRPHDKFRVSDAGRCHLMRYWKRKGKPSTNEPDERALRVFEVGHVFHDWLQSLLYKSDLVKAFAKEVRVEDNHRVGHIDAVINIDGKLFIYDFKTVHSRKFHWNKKENSNRDIHYQLQIETYRQMYYEEVEQAIIAYISKDDLCIKEMPVIGKEEEAKADWNKLIDAWERQEEPEPNPLAWECKYCIYLWNCYVKAIGGETW